jgi:hypothetical protein
VGIPIMEPQAFPVTPFNNFHKIFTFQNLRLLVAGQETQAGLRYP